MSEWTKWTDRRTPNERIPVRLRCKPKHKTVEGISLIEWTTKQSLHGMGHDDMIFVPDGVSDWNGYHRTVPIDLEWRFLCEGEDPKKENAVWHGLSDELAPCPFCGSLPHVSANETRGQRGVICSYSPNRYDTFAIGCCVSRISGMNVPALIAKWNTRPDAERAVAEAVAAERERILRTHNISIEDDLFWYFDDREYGYNDASELLQAYDFEIVHIATGRNTGEMFGFSSGHEHHFFKTEAEAEAAIEAIRSAAK